MSWAAFFVVAKCRDIWGGKLLPITGSSREGAGIYGSERIFAIGERRYRPCIFGGITV